MAMFLVVLRRSGPHPLWSKRPHVHDVDVRLERRHRLFTLAFAAGCALSSAYGFLAGTWPFGVVELLWVLIAVRRYFTPAVGRPLTAGP